MGAFKQFLSQDIKVIPLTINKNFTFVNSEFYTSSYASDNYKHYVGIEKFVGKNLNYTAFSPESETQTGNQHLLYERSVYSSVRELYYTNFLTSSRGDASSAIYDQNITGSIHTPNYENYLPSTLTPSRYFPTASNSYVGVVSIPSKLFGEGIQPKSFVYELANTGSITDDGEGNLIFNSTVIGNIIYSHGLAIITSASGDLNPSSSMAQADVTCSFSSTMTLQEFQYKVSIRESEYGSSLNPSLLKNSESYDYKDFTTSSLFAPYITTVGLYDNEQNLIAVGKLAQPLQCSRTTDTHIIINLDIS